MEKQKDGQKPQQKVHYIEGLLNMVVARDISGLASVAREYIEKTIEMQNKIDELEKELTEKTKQPPEAQS